MNSRREFLAAALAASVCSVSGCGGEELISQPPPPPPSGGPNSSVTPWSIYPLVVAPTSSAVILDLRDTLPPGVRAGGTFEVDPSGAPLPSGLVLSRNGLLSAIGPAVGTYEGVVFAYVEPAG